MWNVNRVFRTCSVNQLFQWLPTQFFRSLPRHVLLIKLQTFCRTVGCAGTATLVDTREKYLLFATIPEAASQFFRRSFFRRFVFGLPEELQSRYFSIDSPRSWLARSKRLQASQVSIPFIGPLSAVAKEDLSVMQCTQK